ncbi:MAG: glutamine-hydrolyzing carbamoyl-phosphate synthase small subunit [Thermoanaerobaculia bacterium]
MTRAAAVLALEDGRIFPGRSAGAEGTSFGEVVFNTALSGYQETLTDPSYAGQIVVMTASHVGNYGLNAEDVESSRIHVAGFAARSFPPRFSNARGTVAIGDALAAANVVAIDELDTRALVRHLRTRGAMRGAVSSAATEGAALARLLDEIRTQPTMAGAALALTVGTRVRFDADLPVSTGGLRYRIAAIDFGMKTNILRRLSAHGIDTTVFPADVNPGELLRLGGANPAEGFDGFFLSNGPGDPAALPGPVSTVAALVESGRPVFGICLGQQLLGLAVGAKTFKLKFGHRGANHPVKNVLTGHVAITSQNHGFTVDPDTLPANAVVTHTNLNDGTCEGFRLGDRPVFAVQYHPESAPGPHDSDALFDEYAALVRAAR